MSKSDSNICLVDWFSITSKSLSVQNIKCLLGLEDATWEEGHGAHGFNRSIYFRGIKIFWHDHVSSYDLMRSSDPAGLIEQDHEQNDLVWLDMSGSGCRAWESFGTGEWDSIFRYCLDRPDDINVTRLDVAFDDHTGLLDIEELKDCVDLHYFVSKMTKAKVEYALDRLKSRDYKAYTLYFGSEKSDVRIRIYDKAKERNIDDEHWIRVETQLRHENAAGFLRALVGHDLGNIYRGVLAEYLRFVVPTSDSNMRRWPTLPAWAALLDGVAAINIFEKKGIEYNMQRLENYTIDMAGAASYTLIRILGVSKFLDLIQNRVAGRDLNPQYVQLLQDSGVDPASAGEWEQEVVQLRAVVNRRKIQESVYNAQMKFIEHRTADLDQRERELRDEQFALEHWLPLARSLADQEGEEVH